MTTSALPQAKQSFCGGAIYTMKSFHDMNRRNVIVTVRVDLATTHFASTETPVSDTLIEATANKKHYISWLTKSFENATSQLITNN